MYPPLLVTKPRRRPLIGRESGFFRPIRPLLEKGRRLDPTAVVNVTTPDGLTVPLCTIVVTTAPRVVLWPILPGRSLAPPTKGTKEQHLIDHVTLDLRNGKSHTTSHNHTRREKMGARLYPLGNEDAQLWVMCAVALKDLRLEPREGSLYLKAPTSDAERQRREFEQFAATLHISDVKIMQGADPATYVCYGIIISNLRSDSVSSQVVNPMHRFLRDIPVDSTAADEPLAIFGASFTLRDTTITVVAACPSGSLLKSGCLGFVTDFDAE